jgi:serine/threonine-protein kinase
MPFVRTSKYRLGRRIGGGGMAEVFRATILGAEGFERTVAVKRITPVFSEDERFARMFINEARIASLLSHPNIVSVVDFDRDDAGQLFLVMEYVAGKDLRQLTDAGRLPPPLGVHVVSKVLAALAYAHDLTRDGKRLDVVHRDVSPHNVLCSWDGAIKLGDFGIAKAFAASNVSQTRSLKGKVGYMSPEQSRGERLDGRSDVFSAGVLLHELLTGKHLFCGNTAAEVLAAMLNQPIAPPSNIAVDVPVLLDPVVLQMLARDREARFADARAALDAVLSCGPTTPRDEIELAALMRSRFGDPQEPARDAPPVSHAAGEPRGATLTAARSHGYPGTLTPLPDAEQSSAAPARRTPRPSRVAAAVVAAALIAVGGGYVGSRVLGKTDSGQPMSSALRAVDSREEQRRQATAAATVDDGATLPVVPPSERAISAGEVETPTLPSNARRDRPARRLASSTGAPTPQPGDHDRSTGDSPGGMVERSGVEATGTLLVLVDPWADVYVEGRWYPTPAKLSLPVGTHLITLRNSDQAVKETVTVTIDAGGTTRIERQWRAPDPK